MCFAHKLQCGGVWAVFFYLDVFCTVFKVGFVQEYGISSGNTSAYSQLFFSARHYHNVVMKAS